MSIIVRASRLKSKDVGIRRKAVYESADIKDPKVVSALIENLAHYPYLQYNEGQDVFQSTRKGAAYALGKIGDPRSIPFLLEALSWGKDDEEFGFGVDVAGGLMEAEAEFAQSKPYTL